MPAHALPATLSIALWTTTSRGALTIEDRNSAPSSAEPPFVDRNRYPALSLVAERPEDDELPGERGEHQHGR
jgi:hypothetical protein